MPLSISGQLRNQKKRLARRRVARERKLARQVINAGLEHFYEQSALDRTESGVAPHDPADPHPELIVSMTTFQPRIPEVHKAVETLLRQTLRPTRIILWISRYDPEAEREPRLLRKQTERGLEIRYCDDDLGPYEKLLHTLQEFPQARIVTVDDDTLYPADMLEQLDRAYRDQPDVVHCHRAKYMTLDADGTPRPYRRWTREAADGRTDFRVFPTGVGGVLYFPGCFAEEIHDVAKIRQLCPTNDDIWFKAMTLKNRVKCRVVPSARPFDDRFPLLQGSQQVSLIRINKRATNGNDTQVKAAFEHFGLSVPVD